MASIGLGSYLGECSSADDARYRTTAARALALGVNLLDSAINYRCQRSERALGEALARSVRDGTVERDEVVVCTKGGYIPFDGTAPADRDAYRAYLAREYYERGIMRPEDVVGEGHCMAPGFLADQLARSRANLGLATIDVYYLHNPEQQLDAVEPSVVRDRMRAAFALLEERCGAGEVGCYGCATWDGLRVPPGERGHISLAELVEIAREAGGDEHRLRVVQLPINLAMSEAVRVPTQQLPGGRMATLLEAASELGISVVASATLLQQRLARGLPDAARAALPGGLRTDAQRAIAFVRSLPVVSAGLVGMRSVSHLEENLGAGQAAPA